MAVVVQPRECAWKEESCRRKLWEKISGYTFFPYVNVEKCQIRVLKAIKRFKRMSDDMCREPCYPDFTSLEDWLVKEGKLKREQVGWYASKHSPVHDFIAEGTRGVWWSETSPSKPFIVDWRLRRVDVLCPFLPTDPQKEVI